MEDKQVNTQPRLHLAGAAEATFDRSSHFNLKFSKKDCTKVLEYNSIFCWYCARFWVIIHETNKCVVDETQYKAFCYAWLSLVASYWHLVCLKIIETHCKSGLAKTGPAGPVIHNNNYLCSISYSFDMFQSNCVVSLIIIIVFCMEGSKGSTVLQLP